MKSRNSYVLHDTSLKAPTQQLIISRFISRTYAWMSLGLILTGIVSFAVASSESAIGLLLSNRFFFYGIMIAELALVIGLTASFRKLTYSMAAMGFLLYSALNGVTFSTIFLVYTMTSVGQVFLLCSCMFGGLAAYGLITKRDLSGLGAFVGMGLWGLILVGLINMFVNSNSLSLGLSTAAVLVFAGLTAYDSQKTKELAYQYAFEGSGGGEESKGSVFAALSLYLNFVNLFLNLLRLLGSKRN